MGTTVRSIYPPVKSWPTLTTWASELAKTLNSTLDPPNTLNSATPVKISPFNSQSNTTKKSTAVADTSNSSQQTSSQKISTENPNTTSCSDQTSADTLPKKCTLFLTTKARTT